MIVVDRLTVWGSSPPDLVEGVVRAGYDAMSRWFHAPPDGAEAYPIHPVMRWTGGHAAGEWVVEGSRRRPLPGDGAFPFHLFVVPLPRDVPTGLKVSLADLAMKGIGPVNGTRRILAAATPFLPSTRSV